MMLAWGLLLGLLAASILAPPRRGGDAGLPAQARPRRRGGRGPRICAVVPDVRSPALLALVCRLVDHVDHVVVAHAGGREAPVRLADLGADRTIEVVSAAGGDGQRGRVSRAAVEYVLAHHAPDAVLLAEPEGAHADAVPAFVAALAGHDAVLGDRSGDPALGWLPRLRMRLTCLALRLRLRRPVPDAGAPMCLLSAEALRRVLLAEDRHPAASLHVRSMLARGLRVAWVPLVTRSPAARRAGAVLGLAAAAAVAVAAVAALVVVM